MHVRDLPKPARRLPIVGDLLRISATTPIQSELALAGELGSLYQLNLGGRGKDIVVTTDHRVIKSISGEDDWAKFLAAPFMVLRDSLTGKGLLTARTSDPLWENAHELLSPGFSRAAMESYHPIVVDAVRDLQALWRTSEGWIDVARDMNRLTLEVISRAGFSDRTFNALSGDDVGGFSDRMTTFLRLVSATAHSVPGISSVRWRRLRAQAEALRAVGESAVANHSPSGERSDLLDRMCPFDPAVPGLPTENVIEQYLTFLMAGNETTAGTLAFALHFLSQDALMQTRIRDELAALGPLEALSYEDVAKLKFTRRVVDEALRLWPVAPAFFRRAKCDTAFESSFGRVDVPKNTVVMAHLVGAHRDTETWGPDAGEFRPDRFLPGELRNHPDRVFRPFGVGPRSCIGRQFAIHEAVLALAGLVSAFEVVPDPEYVLEVDEMITLKPSRLRIKVAPI